MKTLVFIGIVLISGFSAGLIHSAINFALVEPYLDEAINIENQNLFASGLEQNTSEFWIEYDAYRTWQKGGQILAGAILGTSFGALFGIVFAYSRGILPGNHNIKKTLTLAGIMWIAIFLIPFLKYPANPPTVGDPETIVLRQILYASFIGISGFGVFVFYKISQKLPSKQKLVGILGYGIFISIVFIVMPSNPDSVSISATLLDGFRSMSALAVSVFWIANAILLGLFWQKFQPEKDISSKNHY